MGIFGMLSISGIRKTVYTLFGARIPADFDLTRNTRSVFSEVRWRASPVLVTTGALLAALKESGLDKTTDVFVTADHGFLTVSHASATSQRNRTARRTRSYAAP